MPVLFEEIWITPTVAAEYGQPLPTWVVVQPTTSLPTATQVPERFGLGERSAIGLSLTQADCLLIIDDEAPKRLAKALGITCIGTLGIVKLAKEAGLITEVRPWLDKLRTSGGMWLSDAVAERVCRAAGE
ncbi:MAG: DUF3368 domain-containing protein [Hymenobacter sp.]|nr:MAG: DUF3368 domain-containing protein [Hymenobacter sp.]